MKISGTQCLGMRRSNPAVLILIMAAMILPRAVQGNEGPGNRDDDRLQPMMEALRSGGHRLFADAVEMADIRDLVASGNYFTLFAPPDGALHQLGSSLSTALKRHIAIPKFSYADLQRLQPETRLRTLAGNKTIAVTASHGGPVTVDGVPVGGPDVYADRHIAVHGVDGVLHGTAPPSPHHPPPAIRPPLVPPESNDLHPAFPGLYPDVNPLPTVLPYPGRERPGFLYEVAETSWDRSPPSPPNRGGKLVSAGGDSLGGGPLGVGVSPALHSEFEAMDGRGRGNESERRHRRQ